MKTYQSKLDFPGIGILVIALEVLSALSLLFGGISAVFMMFTGEGTVLTFILLSFGGISSAFVIFAIAEFIQLLLKIEYNTRPILAVSTKKKAPARKRKKK